MNRCSRCWSDDVVIGSGFGMESRRGSSCVPERNNNDLLVDDGWSGVERGGLCIDCCGRVGEEVIGQDDDGSLRILLGCCNVRLRCCEYGHWRVIVSGFC